MPATPTNLLMVALAAGVLGSLVGWMLMRWIRRPALALLALAVVGALAVVLIPEPTDFMYRNDIDQQVSFLIMQVSSWIAWMIGSTIAMVGASEWSTSAREEVEQAAR